MSFLVNNAVIMAAGTASRFAPLSYEKPKALIEVKGEILIERQIRQLQEAGIPEIILVVGYKKEHFNYLQEKYGVKNVLIYYVGAVIGSHSGPGTLALFFLGNHR